MKTFEETYVGKLRAQLGNQLLLLTGARIFIEDGQGRLLMQKRADFMTWGFLGGLAEPGEKLEDTIRREVLEESGLTLGKLTPVVFSGDPEVETLAYPNGHECQFFCLMFWTNEFSGELSVCDDETMEFAWHGPDDFPDMLRTMRISLNYLRDYKATGQFQVR